MGHGRVALEWRWVTAGSSARVVAGSGQGQGHGIVNAQGSGRGSGLLLLPLGQRGSGHAFPLTQEGCLITSLPGSGARPGLRVGWVAFVALGPGSGRSSCRRAGSGRGSGRRRSARVTTLARDADPRKTTGFWLRGSGDLHAATQQSARVGVADPTGSRGSARGSDPVRGRVPGSNAPAGTRRVAGAATGALLGSVAGDAARGAASSSSSACS